MGALQNDSRQLEATGYTEVGKMLDEASPVNLNLSVADVLESVNRDRLSPEQGHLPLLTVEEGKAAGFTPPYRDSVYIPNRFLDDVLRFRSSCCAKIVGYMVSRQFQYCDASGVPRPWILEGSESELARLVGCSSKSFRTGIREAIEHGLVECVRQPEASSRSARAIHGRWRLKVVPFEQAQAQREMLGFVVGGGNMSAVPLAFFDYILRKHSEVMSKYIGFVFRCTIGFAEEGGGRRLVSRPMTTGLAMELSGIRDKSSFIAARQAAARQELVHFSDTGRGVVYAIVWNERWDGNRSVERGKIPTPANGDHGKIPTDEVLARKNSDSNRRKIPTSGAADHGNNATREREHQGKIPTHETDHAGSLKQDIEKQDHQTALDILAEHGVWEKDWGLLAAEYDDEVLRQHEYWLYRPEVAGMTNPGANFKKFCLERRPPPKAYIDAMEERSRQKTAAEAAEKEQLAAEVLLSLVEGLERSDPDTWSRYREYEREAWEEYLRGYVEPLRRTEEQRERLRKGFDSRTQKATRIRAFLQCESEGRALAVNE